MAAPTSTGVQTRREDALAHLPVSNTTEYPGGQVIFGRGAPSKSIYLVVTGKVGLSHICSNGGEMLLDIVLPDELFGETALLNVPSPTECATAVGKATVMAWSISDIEDLIMRRPRLGVALLQILVQRNLECNRRLESYSFDTIQRRLARLLIRFSERMGVPEEDGSARMMPITHQALSSYVGTSREIVTQYMNLFRKRGFLSYSRGGITVRRDSLRTVLEPLRSALASSPPIAGSALQAAGPAPPR